MSAELKCDQISGSHSVPGWSSLSVHCSIRARLRRVASCELSSARRSRSLCEYETKTLSIELFLSKNCVIKNKPIRRDNATFRSVIIGNRLTAHSTVSAGLAQRHASKIRV